MARDALYTLSTSSPSAQEALYRVTSSPSGNKVPLDVNQINQMVNAAYDYISLTYVAAGNGTGEIATVTFKTGGAGGTNVAVLTLSYNSDNKLTTVTRG